MSPPLLHHGGDQLNMTHCRIRMVEKGRTRAYGNSATKVFFTFSDNLAHLLIVDVFIVPTRTSSQFVEEEGCMDKKD